MPAIAGMSGGLMANALLRETGRPVAAAEAEELLNEAKALLDESSVLIKSHGN
jgi:hypothetical protein